MTQQNELIETIVEGIQERKGKSITHVDMTGIEWVATQHFIICTGTSTTMVSAIADNIIKEAKEKLGIKPVRMQGMENAFWVIIDFGDAVVHIFLKEYREFYRLEDLWADAPRKTYTD